MEEFRQKRNETLAQAVIKGLSSRNMTGYHVHTKEEALQLALELIPERSRVTGGGSLTVQQIGLEEALEKGDYEFVNRRKTAGAEKRAA